MSAGAAGTMSLARAARIAAGAIGLPLAFRLSQRVGEARGNPQPEGMAWAVGVLGVLFLLRAFATEVSRGPEATLQKDLQWGIAAGCFLTVLRLSGVLGG